MKQMKTIAATMHLYCYANNNCLPSGNCYGSFLIILFEKIAWNKLVCRLVSDKCTSMNKDDFDEKKKNYQML